MSERPLANQAAIHTTPPTDPYAARERHHNEGHGRRLTAAFEALEAFPMLVESRNRVLRLFEAGEPSTADVVAAVEGDVSLAVTVLQSGLAAAYALKGDTDRAARTCGKACQTGVLRQGKPVSD